ncbi:MAG TPA: RNA polymerase sigma factor [Phycisphaerales bacterium]|nr:RNA polymerase sigma factor [Phycisphaerales bacterium]
MAGSLPVTTSLLLDALRDEGDQGGWREFTDRYWPVLVGLGVHLGLTETDAADAAQWTLVEFLREFRAGRYQRGKGRLSAFVIGIAKNRIRALRRQSVKRAPAGVEIADEIDDVTLQHVWEQQRRSVILQQALKKLRESPKLASSTFQAFELVALRDVPAEEAARQAGISVDDVYLARHRCTRRLREIVDELTAAWDQEE